MNDKSEKVVVTAKASEAAGLVSLVQAVTEADLETAGCIVACDCNARW